MINYLQNKRFSSIGDMISYLRIRLNIDEFVTKGKQADDGSYVEQIENMNAFENIAKKYTDLGSQKLLLSITDDAGSLVTKSWTVQKIDIHLDSSFNDKLTYPINEPVSFDYTPYGAISKDIHFKLDGTALYKITTTSSGIPMAYNIQPQGHGSHLIEAYITAEVNGSTVESNHIYKDVIWYDSESDVPVIGCVSKDLTVKQYDTENIIYTVYDPKTETPTVTLSVDGREVSTLQLDSNTQTWQYKPKLHKVAVSGSYNDLSNKPTIPIVGNGTVTIKQGGSSKGTFTMNQSGNTTIELTDNNTTYSTGTASTAGLTKLYTGTGTATDGTMTQTSITTALNGKAASSHTHDDRYYTESEING